MRFNHDPRKCLLTDANQALKDRKRADAQSGPNVTINGVAVTEPGRPYGYAFVKSRYSDCSLLFRENFAPLKFLTGATSWRCRTWRSFLYESESRSFMEPVERSMTWVLGDGG